MQPFTTIADKAIILGQSRDRLHNVYRHLVHPDLMPETQERFRMHLSENLALIGLFAPLLRSAGYSTEEVRGITKAVAKALKADTEWVLVTDKGSVEVISRNALAMTVGDFLGSYSKSGTDLKIFNLSPLRKIARAAVDLTMNRYFPEGIPPESKGGWTAERSPDQIKEHKERVARIRSDARKERV